MRSDPQDARCRCSATSANESRSDGPAKLSVTRSSSPANENSALIRRNREMSVALLAQTDAPQACVKAEICSLWSRSRPWVCSDTQTLRRDAHVTVLNISRRLCVSREKKNHK
ncbi:hypothetical protein Q8A67_018973 [Cirrhinus molitorella]|uniref:Uncharacterized protein n=1 Tax=Cirrhinus molitorella TaxID=172907 RepID=A0AA88PD85_9TELE|nr:hypothetical protein Q8A67_018973 [Cirrhinus molitorella]